MSTKKIILTGRFATSADIEAQIQREERGATFEALGKRSDTNFQSKKGKDPAKKQLFYGRKKKAKRSTAKKDAQNATPETLKPYAG